MFKASQFILATLLFNSVLAIASTEKAPLDGAADRVEEKANERHQEGGGENNEHGVNLNLNPVQQPTKALATPPGKLTLESPAALAKVSGAAATLKWTTSAGAEFYHVQVATDPNFKWLVANEYDVKDTSFEVKDLKKGQQYFWRVAGRKPGNQGGTSHGDFAWSSFEAQ